MILLVGAIAVGFALAAWRLARRLGAVEREVRDLRLYGRDLEALRDESGRSTQDGAAPQAGRGEALGSTAIAFRGGPVSGEAVVAAIRECFDPEVPVNVYDLGLVYEIDIAPEAIAVRMTLTSQECPSARTIPEEVRRRIAALGQQNVAVEVVWEPPWHPSRISPEGKEKLGLT